MVTYQEKKEMKKNMGVYDRLLRAVVAVLLAGLYFSEAISGTTAIILGLIAVIFLFTGSIGFCPLYWPFGFSTRKAESPTA